VKFGPFGPNPKTLGVALQKVRERKRQEFGSFGPNPKTLGVALQKVRKRKRQEEE